MANTLKRYRIPGQVKRLITRNPNKRLRGWLPPAPGWNLRRIILEVAAPGDWFTSSTVRARYPNIPRCTLTYHFPELRKAGWLERQPIEGRGATGWAKHGTGKMLTQSPRARWAYRLTYSGLDKLEQLRAGERDIIGRERSRHYAALAEWMPGRGALPKRVILARLGTRWRGVLTWLRWNYGTPWPVEGRPGWWEWREASKDELFS